MRDMFKVFTMKSTGKLPPSFYLVQDIAKGCLDFDHQGTKIVWWSSDVSSQNTKLLFFLRVQSFGEHMVICKLTYSLWGLRVFLLFVFFCALHLKFDHWELNWGHCSFSELWKKHRPFLTAKPDFFMVWTWLRLD